jgi:protein-disulfide isomerase
MMCLVSAVVLLAAEALAMVNGQPITRADLARAMDAAKRQGYEEAMADLQDVEHAAVRDFLGRQALEHEAAQQRLPADSIYARVMAGNFDRFDPNLRNRIQQQRERVFSTERTALDALIQRRLFETAARAKGMTPEELTRKLEGRVVPVRKTDLDFIKAYEASKQDAATTLPPGEQRLEAAIHNARIEQLRLAVIDSTRSHAKVESRLAPPRVLVSTAGASLVGVPTAPIRIVVFTDFECPYCFEAEQVLSDIRRQYGDRVALYYLNYPLPNHSHARPAAVAAMCAAAQGRYAVYHDLLFAHQLELAHADYPAWAEKAGLDRVAFEACKASGDADRRVEQDIREGIAAGVGATPTFLVNGRLVGDATRLPEVVAEEAAACQPSKGR